MRILQISSAKVFGGSERVFVDLCAELDGRGHEVFVALRPTNEWQSRLAFLPEDRFLRTSIRNSFGMFSAKRIGRFVEARQIDIVHAHVARDYLSASIACRIAGNRPLVLTRHVLAPMKSFHRFALRNVDRVIAVSPAIVANLEKIFPREKIAVIPHGIAQPVSDITSAREMADEFRSLHGIAPGDMLVATLGELSVRKGQRDLVLAANEVVKRFPECRFIVAGKDDSLDKKFRRELRRLVKVLGLDENFLWLDWLDDTGPLFAAADIMVSPSHGGGFGLSILEAMAAGKAVVASDRTSARQLLGDHGLLAPVKDPLRLSQQICKFLEDGEKRRISGEKARAAAERNFGLAVMVDAVEMLYKKVLSY